MICRTPLAFAFVCIGFGACASPGPTPPIVRAALDASPAVDRIPQPAVEGNETEPIAERFEPAALQTRSGWQGNLNILLGMRSLDDAIWGSLDQQPVIGLELDMRPRDATFGFEAGLASAYDWESPGGVRLESWTFELYAGTRATFGDRRSTVHPYLGGGLAWFYTDLESRAFLLSDSDDSFAGYAHAGIYFNTSPGTNVGVDVRSLFGSDLDLFGADADGDYWQVSLIIGGGW